MKSIKNGFLSGIPEAAAFLERTVPDGKLEIEDEMIGPDENKSSGLWSIFLFAWQVRFVGGQGRRKKTLIVLEGASRESCENQLLKLCELDRVSVQPAKVTST